MQTERVQTEQPAGQPRTCLDCWRRVVSRSREYCYFDPQPGIRMPTCCERIQSAVGGFCSGVFVGAITGGFIATGADICQRIGITVSMDVLLKILIASASTPPVVSSIHGALHPARSRLLRAQHFERLSTEVPLETN
jgi:hypothetical protein